VTPSPAEVSALADRWLGDLGHRHVVFDDEAAGERAAAHLPAWERRRTSFMVFRGDVNAVPRDPRARQISDDEMERLQLRALREEVPEAAARSGLADRLAWTQRVLRGTTPARCFGAGEAGGLQSMCTLFADPDVGGRRVAMIEEVGTLVTHRGRGLARAVVGAAVRAAAGWDAQLIVVPADADDWPQVMYAGLGFAPVGRQVSLTRRRRSAGGGL
jgi:GNAT superfamily N-acetyltransferase